MKKCKNNILPLMIVVCTLSTAQINGSEPEKEYYTPKKSFEFQTETETNVILYPDKEQRNDKNTALFPPENDVFSGYVATDMVNPLFSEERKNEHQNEDLKIGLTAGETSNTKEYEPVTDDELLKKPAKHQRGITSASPDTPTIEKTEDGAIGRLQIPNLRYDLKIFDNAEYKTMNKGVGHIVGAPLLNGNVCLAGHNRGRGIVTIGKIKNLKKGEPIIYTVGDKTRTYKVKEIKIIKETETSVLDNTIHNQLTIITCVSGKPTLRYAVIATE